MCKDKDDHPGISNYKPETIWNVPSKLVFKGTKFSNAKAMQALFAHYDSNTNSSIWLNANATFQAYDNNANPVITTSKIIKKYRVDNKRYLLVIAHRPAFKKWKCHVCAPQINLVEFEKQGNGWHLKTNIDIFKSFGSYGGTSPPEIKLLKNGQLVLIFSYGYLGQGYHTNMTFLVMKIKSRYKIVFQYEDQSDNSGVCDGDCKTYSYFRKHKFLLSGLPFPDIKLVSEGNFLDSNDHLQSMQGTLMYQYKNGKYIHGKTDIEKFSPAIQAQRLFQNYKPRIEVDHGPILYDRVIQGDLNNDKRNDVIIEFGLGEDGGNQVTKKQAVVYLNNPGGMHVVAGFEPAYCFTIKRIISQKIEVHELHSCSKTGAKVINKQVFYIENNKLLKE